MSARSPLPGDTMNQDNTPNPASNPLAHLPSYYYLYGRASRYAAQALHSLYPRAEPQYQVFDFSSDRSSAALDKPPHTVDQLLTHGYFAVPRGEPELSILQDRKQTLTGSAWTTFYRRSPSAGRSTNRTCSSWSGPSAMPSMSSLIRAGQPQRSSMRHTTDASRTCTPTSVRNESPSGRTCLT